MQLLQCTLQLTARAHVADQSADRPRAVRANALFRRPFQQLFSTHYTVRMSYERRRETPILWCWLSIEADPSVLILGGVRRVISRRVEAVLIGHARQPSERVAVDRLLHPWYSERGSGDWGGALSRAGKFFWSWPPDVRMSVNRVIDRRTAMWAATRTPSYLA